MTTTCKTATQALANCCRCVALALGLLLGAGLVADAYAQSPALDAQWGGYLRAIGTRTYPDDRSIYQLAGVEELDDFQGELRLINQTFAGQSWSMEIHYELVTQQGETLEKNNELRRLLPAGIGDQLVGPGTIDDSRRLMQLTRIFTEEDDRVAFHRLDRLNLTYAGDWGTLRLGRQALTWGNGLIFNPMDLFNPFAPTSVLRDYKVGDDLAYLQTPLNNGELQLLYVPRRDPQSSEVEDEESSWAGKWHTTATGLELDVMAARHFEDNLLGLGATGYLGGAAWRIDAIYTQLDDDSDRDDFLQVVANLDYAWQWGGKNVYGLVEYFYNGLGRTADYARALIDPALTARLERGEIFTLGRNYLSGSLQYDLHPLVLPSVLAIVNLDDGSSILQPQLAWDAATNLQLIAGASLFQGDDQSEFGGFDVAVGPTSVRAAPASSVFLWLTWYF